WRSWRWRSSVRGRTAGNVPNVPNSSNTTSHDSLRQRAAPLLHTALPTVYTVLSDFGGAYLPVTVSMHADHTRDASESAVHALDPRHSGDNSGYHSGYRSYRCRCRAASVHIPHGHPDVPNGDPHVSDRDPNVPDGDSHVSNCD